jgi:hypothetical protein
MSAVLSLASMNWNKPSTLLANWNNDPEPFVWKATVEVILDKVPRYEELAGRVC